MKSRLSGGPFYHDCTSYCIGTCTVYGSDLIWYADMGIKLQDVVVCEYSSRTISICELIFYL